MFFWFTKIKFPIDSLSQLIFLDIDFCSDLKRVLLNFNYFLNRNFIILEISTFDCLSLIYNSLILKRTSRCENEWIQKQISTYYRQNKTKPSFRFDLNLFEQRKKSTIIRHLKTFKTIFFITPIKVLFKSKNITACNYNNPKSSVYRFNV